MTYWFYRGVAFLVRLLPLPVAYWLGLRICDLFYFLNRRGRDAVRENLGIVFAHQGIAPSNHLLDGCARKTFQYFGKYLADFIRYRKLTPEGIRERVSVQGAEHLETLRNSPRGVMASSRPGQSEGAIGTRRQSGVSASTVIMRAIAASFGSTRMSRTKSRSILSWSSGSRFK